MIKILKVGEVSPEEIFARELPTQSVEGVVADVIARVRAEGDKALYDYTERFDGVKLSSLEVSEEEMEEALASVEEDFKEVLTKAAENIRAFHEKQVRSSFVTTEKDGVVLGQKVSAIEKVALYVPGGTAPLSSTVLMDAIPAKIAGCREIIMTTPPGRDGKINPSILAAAKTAGVTRIFKMGGAQAIAALAYGTESVPAVDKIVGPGNAFVAEAKRQVYGKVSIDMIAGPSEILIVADGKSNPKYIAADLLSQAEHDKNASAVLVTDSMAFALAVQEALEVALEALPRKEIARASVEKNGKIIVAEGNLDQAIEIANEIAPEHLELSVDNPFDYLQKVRHAGSIFMGRYCPESLGDYLAGPNHTLPTGGSARHSSPLSVDDFVKKSQFIYYTKEALARDADQVALFARKEELEAHARSALVRMQED
ncbi:MAG: histidinol dehydrogenase [Clostridia bacterium]|nr:histidinol dehydrogenase [Clostridia bacterium]MBQ4625337.1 histidinol dehydrogenase [Clostridia bacterium]